MEGRVKKPPVNISELRSKEREEPKKGSLSYVKENKRGPREGLGKVSYTQVGFSIIFSGLLALILIMSVSATKKDALTLLDNQRELEARITSISNELAKEIARIDDIRGGFIQKEIKNELEDYVTIDSLADSLKRIEARLRAIENLHLPHE